MKRTSERAWRCKKRIMRKFRTAKVQKVTEMDVVFLGLTQRAEMK
jgi:hypothetical protein